MTRAQRLAVLALAAGLVTTSCQAFDPPPGGTVAPSKPGSTVSASAAPITTLIADFDRSAGGSIVRVVGLVGLASSVHKVDGHYPVSLEDRADPGHQVTAWIPVSDASPPAPNRMAELPSSYSSSDLLLTTDDGSAIHDGDTVALTGIVKSANGSAYLDYVTRIEAAEATAGTGSPEPAATATPAPTSVKIADFDDAEAESVVRVIGLIQAPGFTTTVNGHGSLYLQDATDPTREIKVWVPIGSGTPPPPNTMGDLPSGYKANDLVLAAEDGTVLHHGDAVALTGTVKTYTGGSTYLDDVTRIEVATLALPKPVAVNFATIKKQKAGTLVRLTGLLDVGVLTSCYETCGIYLEDPTTGVSVWIDVTLGRKDELVPNTMWPLPSNYTRGSLRVITNDGRLLKGGVRVRATGWIVVGSDNKRRIDPVIRIDEAP